MTIQKTKTLTALAATAAVLIPALAYAGASIGDQAGTKKDEIRAFLESAGYTVNEIEVEDDEIEVEATLNDKPVEIEISPSSGTVVSMELDDDDDDDDDDDHDKDDNDDKDESKEG